MTEEIVYDAQRLDGLWVFESRSEPARDQIVQVRYISGRVSTAQVSRTMYYQDGVFTVAFRPL